MRPHVTHELNPVDATDPYGMRSRKFRNDLVEPIKPLRLEPLNLPTVGRITFDVDGERFEDRQDRLHQHHYPELHTQKFGATITRFDLDLDLNRIPGSKRKIGGFELGIDPDDDF